MLTFSSRARADFVHTYFCNLHVYFFLLSDQPEAVGEGLVHRAPEPDRPAAVLRAAGGDPQPLHARCGHTALRRTQAGLQVSVQFRMKNCPKKNHTQV